MMDRQPGWIDPAAYFEMYFECLYDEKGAAVVYYAPEPTFCYWMIWNDQPWVR